ncbi:helix-turn-helix transcriptional regulator [Xanthomonas campestris]|uniref:helix-turn-helix transcriptional regulator n=1 Tax=Xanthomonas campestris TaxID=339 RepID=UPI0035566BA7
MNNIANAHRHARTRMAEPAARSASASSLDQVDREFQAIVLKHLERILASFRSNGQSNQTGQVPSPRAVRLPEVLQLLGISRSTLYNRLDESSPQYDPDMPRPFKLGKGDRAPTAWLHQDIVVYIESCVAARSSH